MQDSIETSVAMELFPSITASKAAHAKKVPTTVSIETCRRLENFKPSRLSKTPFPPSDRPRGNADLESVAYLRKQIRNGKPVDRICILKRDNHLILLDGVHRIVAHYLEGKKTVPAWIIPS